jgi:aminotransferase
VNWDGLRAALGPRTRLLVLNTPANPGGFVWTREDLGRLADLLGPSDVAVVTDEIYEDLVYDGRIHQPPATIPGLTERTLTISGLSKTYSVTGWRLGWLAAPRDLAAAIGPVFDTLCVCAPRPLQEAAAEALRVLPESYYTGLRDAYQERRDHLARALRAGGLEPRVPDGAYYMLADYRDRFGEIPSREASLRLLDETHVAAVPGEIFHARGDPPLLRFHFAAETPVLDEVARRLSRAG